MINIVKEQDGPVLVIRMTGAIDEHVQLDKIIGPPAQEMHVSTKGVTRINSVGVKGWIKYFSDVIAKGAKLRFIEASVPIVEQMNLISNFACGAPVESIFVPFSCTKCKAELVGLFKTEDIKRLSFNLPELKCTKCGSSAVFDDIPEEFFQFLTR